MIIGIGVDSVEIARVARKCLDGGAQADGGRGVPPHPSRFMEKMFTPHEIARSLRNIRSPHQHLAACFAAREAFFKATQVWYMRQNVSIAQRESGEPHYVLSERVSAELRKRVNAACGYSGISRVFMAKPSINLRVSLTHDEEYATAFAVLEAISPYASPQIDV
jgi:phosphopantetheine--protein transferase-like protein